MDTQTLFLHHTSDCYEIARRRFLTQMEHDGTEIIQRPVQGFVQQCLQETLQETLVRQKNDSHTSPGAFTVMISRRGSYDVQELFQKDCTKFLQQQHSIGNPAPPNIFNFVELVQILASTDVAQNPLFLQRLHRKPGPSGSQRESAPQCPRSTGSSSRRCRNCPALLLICYFFRWLHLKVSDHVRHMSREKRNTQQQPSLAIKVKGQRVI